MTAERDRKRFADPNVVARLRQRLGDHGVAGRVGHDVEGLHDRHPGAHQRRQRLAEPGDCSLVHDLAGDRQAQLQAIDVQASLRCAAPTPPSGDRADDDEQDQPPDVGEEVRHADQQPGRQRQFTAEIVVHALEHRHDEQQHRAHDEDDEDAHCDGIRHRRFDLPPQRLLAFQRGREAGENLVEHPACLAGAHHRDVQRREDLRMLGDRLREGQPAFDVGAHGLDHGRKCLRLRLLGEDAERAQQRQAGADHRGELTRDDHDVAEVDLSTGAQGHVGRERRSALGRDRNRYVAHLAQLGRNQRFALALDATLVHRTRAVSHLVGEGDVHLPPRTVVR